MSDPYHLSRFIDAPALFFEQAHDELRAGRKKTHWIWFVFPQVAGLGTARARLNFQFFYGETNLRVRASEVSGNRV
jgi:uncharacterized protein (DUF1810 family)